jgi:hypothetical protein
VYVVVSGGVVEYDASALEIIPASDPAFNTQEILRVDLGTGLITHDNRSVLSPASLYSGPSTPSASALSFFYYPRMFSLSRRDNFPDGELWMAAMTVQSASSDIVNSPNSWQNRNRVPVTIGKDLLEEPVAVPVPAVVPALRDGILLMGGAQINNTHASHASSVVSNQCYYLDTRSGAQSWVPFFPMHRARKFANAVLLPDASVLVVGGGSSPGHGVPIGEHTDPEWFHDGQWRLLSNQATGRTYHSVSLLLDDGRVFSAGGNTCAPGVEYEIFEPPYLQGGERPVFLTDPPLVIHYGEIFGFEIELPFAKRGESIVLMKPGSTTHGHDSSQRYEQLMEVSSPEVYQPNFTYTQAPANATILAPGYCMLFVISGGVPSIGRWVQLVP